MDIESLCIIGGTGFVGRSIAEQACARGLRVRVVTRSAPRARPLLVLPTLEAIVADPNDEASLGRCLENMDAAVNLAGILHERRGATYESVHAELPRKIAQACRVAGVRRFLHMSALGASAEGPSAYLRSKARGEAAVREGAAARQWDLDEAIVYGIVRQESRFMPEARSPVGARGLMQLMPSTARWGARQIAITPYRPEMLVRPDVNALMGSYYFRRVLDDLGHPILATAAYNAGPGRARRWRDARPLEGAIYAETIPFNETRDYVKKVFTNAWFYRHRLTGKAASMRELLGTVPGRANEPAVAANIP
ncbi:MAG TPA: transglycosylase SLT domain-containing protein [Usitatibacter sp.]